MHLCCSLQKWREPFKRFALQWLDAINHSFRALVPQMISCDSWTAAEVDFHITPRGNNTTTARREMQKPYSLANSRAGFQSLPHSQLSAFNTVRPSSSLPVEVCSFVFFFFTFCSIYPLNNNGNYACSLIGY